MTEKTIRARLAQLEQELERAQQTIADLAKALPPALPSAWPWPTPAPCPQPVEPMRLPWAITAYMASFPPDITYSGTRPKSK